MYKVNGVTGAIVPNFVITDPSPSANTVGQNKIPNTGSGLGNIAFDFTTAGAHDGIDFTVQGKCVDFHLRLDGNETPDRILVGAKEQRPKLAKFTACP